MRVPGGTGSLEGAGLQLSSAIKVLRRFPNFHLTATFVPCLASHRTDHDDRVILLLLSGISGRTEPARSGDALSSFAQDSHPGALSKEWKSQLARLEKDRTVTRFWNRDLSLWPAYKVRKDNGKNLLNWLDLADYLETSATQVSRLGDSLEGHGFTDIVFLSVSGSSLAAELVTSLSLETRGTKFHVLSLMEPSGLRALEQNLDLRRTVFLVASKSGKNLEMHSLLLYLLARAKSAGLSIPSSNFIAMTEESSYLATLSRENRFRAVLTEPRGFRGRFSGVLDYGYLLGGLCGLDMAKILAGVREMRRRCMLQSPLEQNPAAELAAFLVASAESGFSRFVLRTPPHLTPFAQRIAHLVGCSTCKEEKGIMPFIEEDVASPEILKRGCALCGIRLNGDASDSSPALDIPSLNIELAAIESVAAEIFKWEVATCLACSLLGVNPFEDPDFGDGREAAMDYLDQISAKKFEAPRPRIMEGKLSLFFDGALRHDISGLNLEHALASFFALRRDEAYLAILGYCWNIPEVKARLAALANQMGTELGLPVQLVTGPWYLHLLGQCYKGGPRGGVALMITCEPIERIEVPGAGYTFGDLRLSLALGDMDAMTGRSRPAVRIHLSGTPEQSLSELEAVMGRALRSARRAP